MSRLTRRSSPDRRRPDLLCRSLDAWSQFEVAVNFAGYVGRQRQEIFPCEMLRAISCATVMETLERSQKLQSKGSVTDLCG